MRKLRGRDRVERGAALPGGDADQVADERRVRTLAAVVRCDACDVEEYADVVGGEVELARWNAARGGDRVPRGLQPGIHGWHATRVSKAPPYSAAGVDVVRLPGGTHERDAVAVEEPLEIRIHGEPVAVTMRTPGHDEELALGFCLTEGLAPRRAELPPDLAANTVDVDAGGAPAKRNFYTTSSCGVCGKGALEAVAVEAQRVESDLRVPVELLAELPERLREAQAAFEVTGGLHATGLFTPAGELLCVREDVGRHNAMDKVIGWAFLTKALPLGRNLLCVSGRLSFELVQKAAVAGCPLLVAVGAPSSLAVELAADRGITLCGFVRDGRVNIYTEPWRVTA
jgi:FdhD protein